MTITEVLRYMENRDISAISYKQFNENPSDRYPTVSICFEGKGIYAPYSTLISDALGINPIEYMQILQGAENISKPEFNRTGQVYVDITHISESDFEKFSVNFSESLSGVKFTAEVSRDTVYYSDDPHTTDIFSYGGIGNALSSLPFHVGYQTPDTICFTRNSNFKRNLLLIEDWLILRENYGALAFMRKNKRIAGDTLLKVFVHYPGQLLRVFDSPSFETQVYDYDWDKRLELVISHVTILRRRPDSNPACDKDLEDVDAKLRTEIIHKVKCVPIYWKQFNHSNVLGFEECKSQKELKKVYDTIERYKEILHSIKPSCVDMTVMVTYNQLIATSAKLNLGASINFLYKGTQYQAVENQREFGFEAFWSGVGGFVGIFCGYSLLQLPDLFEYLFTLFNKKIQRS